MKIFLDTDLCEANGLCEQFAPNTFALSDDDELEVSSPVDDADEIARVRTAVAACPRAALTLDRERS